MKTRVAIIGGGAAGLMAAIVAARNGADVCIYEKLNRVGKKILATGNGRCNYTNINTSIRDYHGKNLRNLSTHRRKWQSISLFITGFKCFG